MIFRLAEKTFFFVRMLFANPLRVGAKFSRKRGGDAPPRPVFSLFEVFCCAKKE